jgi:phosphatidyl-N-methylethanolamine N-methyltransferase
LIFVAAAILLAIERVAYVWVWRHPASFAGACKRMLFGHSADPVIALERLFDCFKATQILVFLAWCYFHPNPVLWSLRQRMLPVGIGVTLFVVGQILNFSVFYRLGTVGVFYGNRFGRDVPWCNEFPFSLMDHPQYVGALLSIWGFFLAAQFPNPTWYSIPILETVYYAVGAYLEQ